MKIRSRRAVASLCCAALSLTAIGLTSTSASASPSLVQIMCPAPAGNARLVRQIYFQILNRCAEPAGMAYWTGQLDSGLGRGQFADMVDTSDENMIQNNVLPIYRDTLNRAPSAAEQAQWVDFLRTNHQDGPFIATLGSSDEAYNMVPGATPADKDQAWLSGAYNHIVDRDPDPAGRAYFTGLLGTPSTQASRFLVAMDLEFSQENAEGWVGAVYGAAFGRAPDQAGMQFWVGWLFGEGHFWTFRMWTTFLSSQEGYDLAQTQPNPQPQQRSKAGEQRIRR